MNHPLLTQLYFTRSEWQRAFAGISDEEAVKRFEPMNCLSWLVGHLAWQEQSYWLERAQGKTLVPELANFGFGQPASTPPLAEMWSAWEIVTEAANPYLETLTPDQLRTIFPNQTRRQETIGTMLYRMIYHYWYHLGESQAIRQLLGHENVGGFVGNMKNAQYQPETD